MIGSITSINLADAGGQLREALNINILKLSESWEPVSHPGFRTGQGRQLKKATVGCSLCALCLHCCSGTRQMHLGPAVLSRRRVSRSYEQDCVLACGYTQDQHVSRSIIILGKVKIVTNLQLCG